MAKKRENGSVVKIDSSLLAKVEEFISKEENKLKFVNKKQFIDLAVNGFLIKLKGKKSGK
jgi:hypothetical protein